MVMKSRGILKLQNLNVIASGSTIISAPAAGAGMGIGWQSIAHNLGFAPQPLVFLNDIERDIDSGPIFTDGNLSFPSLLGFHFDPGTNSLQIKNYIEAAANKKNLFIVLYNADTSPVTNLGVDWYLLQQKSLNQG